MGTRALIIIILLGALGAGCTTTRPAPTGTVVRGPVETAEFYLNYFYRSQMARQLYETLAPAARARLSYTDFLLQRQREIALPEGEGAGRVVRVEAAMLDGYRVNERQQVLYVLQKVRYPYSGARDDHYRLVRLNVVYEHDRWYVEPFVDERTFTVRLLPALKRDALRNLYDQREAIARIVADDIEAMRLGTVRPAEEVATDTEKIEIPNLADTVKVIPGGDGTESSDADSRDEVAALLESGKLHYRARQLDLAEEAFRGVLELDPLNATAKDYLERVRQTRQLEKERQEMIKLIEQLLDLETQQETD